MLIANLAPKNIKFVENEKVDVALNLDNAKKITVLVIKDDGMICMMHNLLLHKAGVKSFNSKERRGSY